MAQGLSYIPGDGAVCLTQELLSLLQKPCTREHVHYDSIKLCVVMLRDKDRVRLVMISLPFSPSSYISTLNPGVPGLHHPGELF